MPPSLALAKYIDSRRGGMAGLRDASWIQALAAVYGAYQASAASAHADDAAVDYLRDQVHAALQDIRFLIRHGQVSPGQALSAGQQVIAAFYAQTGAMPRASSRQRAENYRAVFTANAALNQSEAEWFYGLWDCPDITTQAQIGEPRCTRLSATATVPNGQPAPAGGVPSGTPAAPVAGSIAAPDSILNLLGSVDLLGFSVPILPVAVLAGILLFKK